MPFTEDDWDTVNSKQSNCASRPSNDNWDDWGSGTTTASAQPAQSVSKPNDDWDDWSSENTKQTSNSTDWGNESMSSDSEFANTRRRGFGRGIRIEGGRDNGFEDRRRDFNRQDSDKSTFKIPSSEVGRVIGRGGSTIKDLQTNSGARIKINSNRDSYDSETVVDLFGTEEQRNKAMELINGIVEGGSQPPKQFKSYESKSQESSAPQLGFVDWDAAITESAEHTRKKWAALPPVKKNFYFEDPEVTAMHPEEVKQFRIKNNNIMVDHFNQEDRRPIPNPVETFSQGFEHYPEILAEIVKQGFEKPSPIQAQSWPILLQGIDLIGIAQTGTGKTLAYLLPAMIHIDQQPTPRDNRPGPTALIMAPTRELAQQIEREARKYSYRGIKTICIYGGGDRRQQIGNVGKGVEIVIATPGRLNDLCMNRFIDLTSVSYLVLDEADRMLDMGFEPQIKKIMLDIRPERQTVMMSATWPIGVQRLVVNYMTDPMQIRVGTWDLAACHSVTQRIIMAAIEDKRNILYTFVSEMKDEDKVIIFVDKKVMADELSSEFALKGITAQCIHGDRDQSDREQALADLRAGDVRILIATDVASRGLDIDDITHIFNFDFPRNVEEYVHRIGRTGRAGREGESITIFTRDDWRHANELIKILAEAGQVVPDELAAMAERYTVWKKKYDEEMESCGGRRGRGGRGGGGGRRFGGNRW